MKKYDAPELLILLTTDVIVTSAVGSSGAGDEFVDDWY